MEYLAKNVPGDARNVVETLLGRSVRDEETISINSGLQSKDAPPLAERLAIADELDRYLAEIDRKTAGIDPDEVDSALDEAMLRVRPTFKRIR
jgi:hypothetical protein